MKSKFKRSSILSILLVLVGTAVLFFQNCSPVGFATQEFQEIVVSSQSTNAQDVIVVPAEVCSSDNTLQFEVIYKADLLYKCYDLTAQKFETGLLCSGGPILNPINSVTQPTDCTELKVCGTLPVDIIKAPGEEAGTTKVTYKYNNIPLGCGGKIRVEEHTVNAANEPAINVVKEIALALPKGTCKTCSNGSQTCGECAAPISQVCTPNSIVSCSISNGTGTKTCVADGSQYGPCIPVSCNTGYYISNGQCVPLSCTPGSTAPCLINNGTGSQTCNPQGTGYGSCNLVSCNTGFVVSGNTCVSVATPNVSVIFSKTLNGTATSNFAVGDTLHGKVSGVSAANAYACIEYPGSPASCSDVNTYTKMPNADWSFDGTFWRSAIALPVDWGGKTFTAYWYDSVSKKTGSAVFTVSAAPVVLTLSRTLNGASATSFNVGELVYFKVSGVTATNAYACTDWIGAPSMCTDLSKFTKMPNADWSFDGTFWRAAVTIDSAWGGKTFTGYWKDTFTGGAGQRTFTVSAVSAPKSCEIVVKPNSMISWPGTRTNLTGTAFQVDAKLSPANAVNSFLYAVSYSYNESTIRVSFCAPGMTAAEMSSATTAAGGLWGHWSAFNSNGYGINSWGTTLCLYMSGGNFNASGSYVNGDGTHRIKCDGYVFEGGAN